MLNFFCIWIIILGTLDPFIIIFPWLYKNHKKLPPPLNNKHGQKKWKCLELDSSRLYGRRNHFARWSLKEFQEGGFKLSSHWGQTLIQVETKIVLHPGFHDMFYWPRCLSERSYNPLCQFVSIVAHLSWIRFVTIVW